MKRAFFVLLVCACSAPRTVVVEIAAPLASATVAPPSDEVVVPRSALRVPPSAEGPWVADFPTSKTFAVYDVPDARRVLLTWRVGPSHFEKRVGEDDDEAESYPVNHVASVDLVVRARDVTRVISFGALSGHVDPPALSWCKTTDPSSRAPSFASTFAIGIAQGDDELAIVRDGQTLHVLHRETSDGYCEETKQGPLDVCDGAHWERVADIRVATRSSSVELYEIVEEEGKTFDCRME
jgi:hypothetical protein